MKLKLMTLILKKVNNRIIFHNCKIIWDREQSGHYIFAKVFSFDFRYLGLLAYDGEKDRFAPGTGVVTRYSNSLQHD